jgi:hypothetical protein
MSMDGYFSMIENERYFLVEGQFKFLQEWLENAKVI